MENTPEKPKRPNEVGNYGNIALAIAGNRKAKLERQQFFLDIFPQCGFNISKACHRMKIDRGTVRKWRENIGGGGEGFIDKDGEPKMFSERFDELKEQINDEVIDCALNQIRRGNPLVTMFWLETRAKDRGFEKRRTVQVQHQVISKERKDAIVRAVRISHGNTSVESIEGTPDAIKKLREPGSDSSGS